MRDRVVIYFLRICPHGALQIYLGGHDVARLTAGYLPDGDHALLERVGRAGHDGLQLDDELRRSVDRVGPQMGHGPVRVSAVYCYVYLGGRGHQPPRLYADAPLLYLRHQVQPEHRIHPGVCKRAAGYHVPCAGQAFLAGLEQKHDVIRKLIAVLPEQHRKRKQNGHVPVVPAGVHHARDPGCVGDVVQFADPQRVHVRAEAQRPPGRGRVKDGLHPCVYGEDGVGARRLQALDYELLRRVLFLARFGHPVQRPAQVPQKACRVVRYRTGKHVRLLCFAPSKSYSIFSHFSTNPAPLCVNSEIWIPNQITRKNKNFGSVDTIVEYVHS
jgi:hypothetical protein